MNLRTLACQRAVAALLVGIACANCGGKQSQPSPAPPPASEPPRAPPASGVIQVTGSERITWDQQPMPESTTALEFAAYVDVNRVALPDVRCAARADGNLDCSAQLPPMSAGLHLFRIAAIGTRNGRLYESSRSEPLFLTKVAALTPTAIAAAAGVSASDPADAAPSIARQFAVEKVATTSGSIADLALGAAGELFAAERLGRVLLQQPGAAALVDALELPDVATSGGRGLFSIALHPDFAANGLVYWLYAAQTADEPVYRIARGRVVAGRIGEIAVLLDAAPVAPDAWGVLRFGPDRRLYAALGDDPAGRSAGGSYLGKLLRLDDDGRAASDNATASPIVGSLGGAPVGLVWTGDHTRAVLRQSRAGREILLNEQNRDVSVVEWSADARPAGLAYVANAPGAADGHLYAGDLRGGVHRVRWPAAGNGAVAADVVIARGFGAVRGIAAAADGSIYFGTANIDLRLPEGAPAANDSIVRITPRAFK